MKFSGNEIRKLSQKELVRTFKNVSRRDQVKMLKLLNEKDNIETFTLFLNGMEKKYELNYIAEIHPYKEAFLDKFITEIEENRMKDFFCETKEGKKSFDEKEYKEFCNSIYQKTFWQKFKERFTGKQALPDTVKYKLKKLKDIVEFRAELDLEEKNKFEKLETLELFKESEIPRIDLTKEESSKLFDRIATKLKYPGFDNKNRCTNCG